MSNQPPKIVGIAPTKLAPLNGGASAAPIERPSVMGVEVKLKMPRAMVEKMFQRARFIDSDFKDGHAIITEKLRVAKEDEQATVVHVASGVNLCVDHYELDGVIL